MLGSLKRTEWVVYYKPPFGGPEHVLKYLAPYTHRVAISNGRLISVDNGLVRFFWLDSRHGNHSSTMRLEATEFIRRFLLHVLSSGFVKIRHFGLLANRNRRNTLAQCRIHLRSAQADLTRLLDAPSVDAALFTSLPVQSLVSRAGLLRLTLRPSTHYGENDAHFHANSIRRAHSIFH